MPGLNPTPCRFAFGARFTVPFDAYTPRGACPEAAVCGSLRGPEAGADIAALVGLARCSSGLRWPPRFARMVLVRSDSFGMLAKAGLRPRSASALSVLPTLGLPDRWPLYAPDL